MRKKKKLRPRNKDAIKALTRLLPDWLPLWETVNVHDRLVYLSPPLIAQYKALLRAPPISDA